MPKVVFSEGISQKQLEVVELLSQWNDPNGGSTTEELEKLSVLLNEVKQDVDHTIKARFLEMAVAAGDFSSEWLDKEAVDYLINPQKYDPVENLKQLKDALEQHVETFLDYFNLTEEYSERFDIKITLGDKTFNLPLGAELNENFKKMIQAEIDDIS